MGVDTAYGGTHRLLGLFALKADLRKGLAGICLCGLHTRQSAASEIGLQRYAASHKGEDIHILVAAVIVAIRKPGFWRGTNFR